MKTIPYPISSIPAPTIHNRQQLDSVIENIVQIQLDRAQLDLAQEKEIADIRQKYRPRLAELDRYLITETTWAEAWALANPGAFTDKRSLECTHAIIGFRVTPPRVERASRKWNWSDIAAKLGELGWGQRYLRTPAPEVNKEALLSDRAEFTAEELRQVGVKIVRDERFYITPRGVEAEAAEPLLREAA